MSQWSQKKEKVGILLDKCSIKYTEEQLKELKELLENWGRQWMTHSPWHWPQCKLIAGQWFPEKLNCRNSNPKWSFWKILKVLLASSRRYWCSKDHTGWLFFWFIVYNNQDNNLNQQNKNYISKSIRKLDELRKGLCSENFNQYSIVFSRLYSQNEKKNYFSIR